MKIKGQAIFVQNLKESTDTYSTLFGIDPTEQTDKSTTFQFGTFRFFIHEIHEQQENFPPSEDHLEIEIENVDEAFQRLLNAGFEEVVAPQQYYWGYSGYVRDREGRMLELCAVEG